MALGPDGFLNRIRKASFGHPRLKWLLREAWGATRLAAVRVGLPKPFEPPEFADLRAISRPTPTLPGQDRPILFLSMRGWSTALLWELTFAHAVEVRGGNVVFAFCGGRLPICDVTNVHSSPPMPCMSCSGYARDALEASGFSPIQLTNLIDLPVALAEARRRVKGLATVHDMEAFVDGDVEMGRLMRTPALWFLSRGTLVDSDQVRNVFRRFLVSGLVVRIGLERLLDQVDPARIFMINGRFFAEAILFELARRRNVPVTTYERGFMTDSVVVTPDRMAADYEIEPEFWERVRDVPLPADEETRLDMYIDARTRGERAADQYWKKRVEDVGRVRSGLQLTPGRPLVSLYSNIVWDTAAQDCEIAFPSLADWVVQTIEGFATRPEVDLVVRVHPAEVRVENHRTNERLTDLLAKRVPHLPANVRVVPPESPLSSYTLMRQSDLGLVYTSTAGLEMAMSSVPVVVAADVHYRNRGFTHDVTTTAEYWEVIDELLATPPDSVALDRQRALARRYANLFFFGFTQHPALVHELGRARPRLRFASREALLPGRDSSVDRIVAAITEGKQILADA
jgi:hypothetical protein